MTRFARARGSKSCNERREEEATPWHVMRQQLASQLGSTQPCGMTNTADDIKPGNVNTHKSQEVWTEFDEPEGNKRNVKLADIKQKKANQVKAKKLNKIVKDNVNQIKEIVKREINTTSTLEKLTLQVKGTNIEKSNTSGFTQNSTHDLSLENTKSVRNSIVKSKSTETKTLDIIQEATNNKTKSLTDKSKKCKKMKMKPSANNEVKTHTQVISTSKPPSGTHLKQFSNRNNLWNNKELHTIIANGREIHVVRYDGFFVKQDDAIELKKLRKKLKAQNITADKIKEVLKLERRKAEKALAREKNSVCFQCRKFGHNFADCPEILDSNTSTSGMCFKCGSMEHTYFECKISQHQNFRFAVCFVCKEQGHIARQCPSNPKGQYPKGGACHLCGEITHLRKDCPKAVVENQNNSLTVAQLKNTGLEDIIIETSKQNVKPKGRKNKIVKF